MRLFSFGVGDDVDAVLLDTLTSELEGMSSYVRPTERIDEEVASLFSKISAPALTNVELDFGGLNVESLYPAQPLPDLAVGQALADQRQDLLLPRRQARGVRSTVEAHHEITVCQRATDFYYM